MSRTHEEIIGVGGAVEQGALARQNAAAGHGRLLSWATLSESTP